jgi:anti-sigma B factor antagonist
VSTEQYKVWRVDRRLGVNGEMTIYTAASLQTELFCLLQSGPEALDLSGVTEMDTAGLQLVIMAQHCVSQTGGLLRVARASPVVQEVFDLLNLTCGDGERI